MDGWEKRETLKAWWVTDAIDKRGSKINQKLKHKRHREWEFERKTTRRE